MAQKEMQQERLHMALCLGLSPYHEESWPVDILDYLIDIKKEEDRKVFLETINKIRGNMKYSRDYIAWREFLPSTQEAFKRICEQYLGLDAPSAETITTIEWWASFFFLLRAVPDKDEFFPSGKWATIQRLEDLLNEYAKDIITYREKEKH